MELGSLIFYQGGYAIKLLRLESIELDQVVRLFEQKLTLAFRINKASPGIPDILGIEFSGPNMLNLIPFRQSRVE